jgi:hypothetical protein
MITTASLLLHHASGRDLARRFLRRTKPLVLFVDPGDNSQSAKEWLSFFVFLLPRNPPIGGAHYLLDLTFGADSADHSLSFSDFFSVIECYRPIGRPATLIVAAFQHAD